MSLQSFTREKNKSGSRESCIIPLPISISNTRSFTNTIITALTNRFPLLTYNYTSNIQKSCVKARGSFNSTSNSVIVSEKQDIQKLWKQGFFGKGNLSRSEPTYEWRDGNKDSNDDKNETEPTYLIDAPGQPDITSPMTLIEQTIKIDYNDNKEGDDNLKIDADENYNDNKDEDDIIQNRAAFIQENLQLTTEEAFFLSFGLGCLEIYDTNDNLMTIRDCWNAFRTSTVSISSFPSISTPNSPQDSPLIQLDNPFIVRYVVYHYFRSLGWVVRGGMKFGCDYVLPYYLSATSNTNNNHFRHNVTTSWQLMSNLSRVCVQVKKSLVLCYVIIPPSPLKKMPDLSSHEQIQTLTSSDDDKHHINDKNNHSTFDLNNPFECIKHYKIKEVLIKRCTPERV
ncbi:9999_t:CDS:2, partial [Cetraspora pellucida]